MVGIAYFVSTTVFNYSSTSTRYFTRTIHMIVRYKYLHENFIETTVPYTCTCIFTSDKKLLVLYLVDRENTSTSTVQSLEIGFVPGA